MVRFVASLQSNKSSRWQLDTENDEDSMMEKCTANAESDEGKTKKGRG